MSDQSITNKIETIFFRSALIKKDRGYGVFSVTREEDAFNMEKLPCFVSWIDGWQETEVNCE